jgi:serine/threonine-protein kinase
MSPENPYTAPTAQITDPALEIQNDIRKKIRYAWIAAIVSGSLNLFIILAMISGTAVGIFGLYALAFIHLAEILGGIYTMIINAALFFGLAFGIYKKSRTCAIMLFAYFTISQIFLRIETGQTSGLFVSIIFIYFFWQGVSGTFAYHKLKNHKQA